MRREEQYFDAEEVLGRDTKSVFPNESRKATLQSGAAKAILEKATNKFISETELAEVKAAASSRARGNEDTGSLRPLAEILREQKEAKEARFQDQWKQMKTGKNRPLDDDELEFLDGMAAAEAAHQRRLAAEENAELEAFQKALKEKIEGRITGAEDTAVAIVASASKAKDSKPAAKPRPLKMKPRIAVVKRGGPKEETSEALKRQRVEEPEAADHQPVEKPELAVGLPALLGDYGTESD